MTQLNFLMFAVTWVVLAGEGRMTRGVLGWNSYMDAKGRSRDGATHNHSHHLSAQPLQDPESLEPTEPPSLSAHNTSYAPQGSYSRPYRLVEILNTSKLNSSSPPSLSPTSSAPELQVSDKRFNVSLSSPAQPLINPNTTASYISGPSRAPNLRGRVAAKELRAPQKNYTPVNLSLTSLYALPNWERAPRVLTTQGNYSRVYRLPSWESSLSLFGVKSNSEVRISLLHVDMDEAPVNITLYADGREGESEIQFNLSRSNHVIVSPYKLSLSLDNYTWFTIFRKGHVVYVFLANKFDPFLVYEHFDNKLELLKYTRFQVWSKGKAYWDFVGKNYKNENKNNFLTEKSLLEELDGIKEGLAERYGLITNLVSVLQRPSIVNNLTLMEIQKITDIGESVIPLRNILFFYGLTEEKKMHWTST